MAKTSASTQKDSGLSGERRRLVLAFVDVVGSTALSTKMESEDFANLMLAFQKFGTQTFEKFGGKIANYLGDGLLVYFGYPRAQENDAERAVRAAFELLGGLGKIGQPNLKEPLQARVGIHAGPVIVGQNSDGLGDILLGETVNVAARIQSAASPGTIFTSESALDLLKGKFASRPQPPIQLKGIANKVVLHHLHQSTAAKRPVPRTVHTLVGRDEELARLKSEFESVLDGKRSGVCIFAEPGLGKSTLVDRFQASLAETPHTWLEARCDVLQTGAALHPFIELALKSLGIADPQETEDAATRLKDGLATWEDRPADAFPVIANLLGIRAPETSVLGSESPESLRKKTLETLVHWIEFLSTQRPVVLVCEDLHWSDATTIDLLNLMLERDIPARFLCLVTSRNANDGIAKKLIGHTIELPSLAETDAQQLIRTIDDTQRLSIGDVEQLIDRAQGVPLFLEELTRQALRDEAGHHSLIPTSLDGLVMQQLDGLPGNAKGTAQVASVLGQAFDQALLAAVSELDADGLEAALDQLLGADLIRQHERQPSNYFFRHALTRDGAYGTLLRQRRKTLHAATADQLMTQFSRQGAMNPSVVAHHLLESEQFSPAAEWFKKAGRSAAKQAAVEDATTLYRRALEALEGAPETPERNISELSLQILLGNALMGVRGFGSDEIVPVWERALSIAETLNDYDERSSALNGLAAYWIGKGDCGKACEFALQILSWSEPANHRIGLLRAHSSLANAKFQIGDVQDALDHAETAVSLYQPDDFANVTYGVGTDQGVVAYGAAAASHWWLGAAQTGLRRACQGVALAEGLESALSLAAARSYLALIHHYRGDEELAYEVADETVMFCANLGIPFWQGLCLLLRAGQKVDPPAKRLQDIEAGLGILSGSGSQSAVGLGFSIMASAQADQGNPEIALGVLKTGGQMSAMLGQHFWDAELKRLLGVVQATMGDRTAAVESVSEAVDLARDNHASSLELRALLTLDDVLGSEDRTTRNRLATVLKTLEPGTDTPDAQKASRVLTSVNS
ncbi:AAA family ATPase [Ruegeria sp. 6PALISEP08]|uniref:ATP-binding protein n=1 Tax=Ruegeria sp. 6PALISEP08 TaxID=1225660 RepID=UPI0012EE3115|nr:adenylate/guanylate cyclase domain-containing protein [Ruegeria sp. 6PALISEP08]